MILRLTPRVLRGVLALALLTPGLATGVAAYMAAPAAGVAQTGLATVPLTIQTATTANTVTPSRWRSRRRRRKPA